MASEQGGAPGAWLGLLKWSLQYSDGTSESDVSEMSAEDRAFLEAVMKDGIINENDRMKEILSELATSLESLRSQWAQDDEERVLDLLQDELRDIVEQVDFANAFALSMGGLKVMLGCASEARISRKVRSACLGVVATLCQNNPPVQLACLEMEAIPALVALYLREHEAAASLSENDTEKEDNNLLRCRIMQALSAAVRNHDMAEEALSRNVAARQAIELGLGVWYDESSAASQDSTVPNIRGVPTSTMLQRRCLFLLRAVLTSDSSNPGRVQLFQNSIKSVVQTFLLSSTADAELRDMALELAVQLVRQWKAASVVVDDSFRGPLTLAATERIAAVRQLEVGSEDRDSAMVELDNWEALLVEMARLSGESTDDEEGTGDGQDSNQPVLLLAGGPANETAESLPQ